MSESSTDVAKKPLLSNTLYDLMKKVVTVVLPAGSALYVALAHIWDLPKAEEVSGSIAALALCLGALMGISSKSYNNSDTVNGRYVGDLVLVPHPENPNVSTFQAHLNEDPTTVASMSEVTFKVQPEQK